MASYVIGDIHGCFKELTKLLDLINYDSSKDRLLFTGDLVNGGPDSIKTLSFIKGLDNSLAVLGNHDLTLLGLASGSLDLKGFKLSGFNKILAYNDKQELAELLDWLKKRPLVYFDKEFNLLLVHAGLYPNWGINKVCELAQEVENILVSTDSNNLFANMFGNLPDLWNDDLQGWDRIRFIINACTRMRFCSQDGRLELITKGKAEDKPQGFVPWFTIPNKNIDSNTTIAFGHWSALVGTTNVNNIYSLDGGCIWGSSLIALRLEDKKKFAIDCPEYCNY